MQDYLPIIKTTLLDWLQLTFANPLYAVSIAIAVYLLVAIVYGIRIAILKRKHNASELARAELLKNLTIAQQRETELKEQLTQRNQQIAGTVQTLAASFDLGETPLSVSEEINPDALWQQHERAVALLASRLRSEQQAKAELQQSYAMETAKRSEKEALAESLQTALTDKTALISKQEQALQEQKSLLFEEQKKTQETLIQIVEKHLAVMDRLAELEKQAVERVHDKIQSAHLEEKPHVNEVQLAPVLNEMPVVEAHTPTQVEALQADLDEKLDTKEVEPTQVEEEIVPTQASAPTRPESLQTAEEEPRTIVLPDWENAAESPAQTEKVAPAIEPAKGVAGKMKNIFGKARPERLTTQAESVAVEVQSQPTEEEKRSPGVAQKKLGKFKNLFSKTK